MNRGDSNVPLASWFDKGGFRETPAMASLELEIPSIKQDHSDLTRNRMYTIYLWINIHMSLYKQYRETVFVSCVCLFTTHQTLRSSNTASSLCLVFDGGSFQWDRSLTLRESVTYKNETSTEQERFRDTLLCIRKWRRVHTLFLLGRIFITTYEVEESDSVRVVHVGILGFEIPVKLWSCEVTHSHGVMGVEEDVFLLTLLFFWG